MWQSNKENVRQSLKFLFYKIDVGESTIIDFYFFSISLKFFLFSFSFTSNFFFLVFFARREMQRPHVVDYLRTKHHQHNIKEARDNQTIEQQIDTCALVAVQKAVARRVVIVVVIVLTTYIPFLSSFILASICSCLAEDCIKQTLIHK